MIGLIDCDPGRVSPLGSMISHGGRYLSLGNMTGKRVMAISGGFGQQWVVKD